MATPGTRPPTSKRQELRQDRFITLYARAWAFYEENRKLVYGLLVGLVVLVLLIIGYIYYRNQQQAEAERLLGRIVNVYEEGRFQEALEGTGDRVGLLEIADDYGSTQAGNLAAFYAADAYYQLGEYDGALEYFQRFDKQQNIIGASAYAGEAAIYEDREEYEQAAERYRRAALFHESQATSPRYLLSAARAYEKAGQHDEAIEMYEILQERYPDSEPGQEVARHIARVRAQQDG